MPKKIRVSAGLIVMGGPQCVQEHNHVPWLRDEIRLIDDALNRQKPVLGVCLGSQLLAAAIGATVYPRRTKETGWNRVTLVRAGTGTPIQGVSDPIFTGVPKSFVAFHWHGDIFDLPQGAMLLASSSLTANQAFRYARNAYGLLFHMEMTPPQVHAMTDTFADELHGAGLNGLAIELNAHTHLSALQQIGFAVFRQWVALRQ